MTSNSLSIVMLGGSGAVGTQVLRVLLKDRNLKKLTLLGRNPILNVDANFVHQYKINIFDSNSYASYLKEHDIAICTLGVGEPSKISKDDFLKIDKNAVLDFAIACKQAGVSHFELLSSVGINPESSSFYLRAKGELVEELKTLAFERLSIFQPSMILTPINRYGATQAIVLKVWPLLKFLLNGNLTKYRGIPIDILGKAIALNIFDKKAGLEMLKWEDFYSIIKKFDT